MGNANPIRTLGDYSKPSYEGYRNTIELLVGNNVVPLRSDTIRLVQNGCSFHGHRSEDPNQHLKDFLKLVDSLDLDALGVTFEARVWYYMASHTKRMERFENAIFKQREEINDEMAEMFRLLKELTTSRALEKVLIKEEAKSPVTKNINYISLARGKKEKNDNDYMAADGGINETNTEIPIKDAKKETEAKNETKINQSKELKEKKHRRHPALSPNSQRCISGCFWLCVPHRLHDKEDEKWSIILGTPILTMAKAMIKFDKGTITLRSRKSKINFHRIPESRCRKAYLLEDKQIPSVGVFDELRLIFTRSWARFDSSVGSGESLEECHEEFAYARSSHGYKRSRMHTIPRRAPEKVLIKEVAKSTITKNINSISLARGKEQKNDNDYMVADGGINETDTEMPVKEAKKETEAENGTKNKPIKRAEREETSEASSSQPVGYYQKHRINEKLIEGLFDDNRFNDSLSGNRVRKVKGKTYNLLPRRPVYEAILRKKITRKEDIGGNFEIPCNIGGLKHMNALEDEKRPFILGTPILTMAKAVIKFDKGTITLRSEKSKISFHKIHESLCKVEKGIKNDIEPIASTMAVNRLVLKWEEKKKLHHEKEMKFDQWRSKNFINKHPDLVKVKNKINDAEEFI
nr:MAK10-like protein [Tanacetum cinerariifolium]